jgi:hypothetical protein
LLYPGLSTIILEFFLCKNIVGEWYLLTDINVNCFDDRWVRMLPWAIIFTLIYPVLIPVVFLKILYNVKKRNLFDDRLTREKYGIIFRAYTKDNWFFEVVDMIYKLFMTSCLVFLSIDYRFKAGMFFCFSFMVVVLLRFPYLRLHDDRTQLLVQAEILNLFLLGQVMMNTIDNEYDRTLDLLLSALLLTLVFSILLYFLALQLKFCSKSLRKYLQKRRERIPILRRLDPTFFEDEEDRMTRAESTLEEFQMANNQSMLDGLRDLEGPSMRDLNEGADEEFEFENDKYEQGPGHAGGEGPRDGGYDLDTDAMGLEPEGDFENEPMGDFEN